MQTLADQILNSVYTELGLGTVTDDQKYRHINDIVALLRTRNKGETINVKTTGTISERLCELALQTAVPNIYKTLPSDWKWIGDFSIVGNPFNVIISVKSFKAKERLMASGSGNILSPTIGWGLFDDADEWTEDRIKGYLFRAFIAIYMPEDLLNSLPLESKNIQNINGKKFLRRVNLFIEDLQNAISNDKIDITRI